MALYSWRFHMILVLLLYSLPNTFPTFFRLFDEYEDYDFARTGSLATEKVFHIYNKIGNNEGKD